MTYYFLFFSNSNTLWCCFLYFQTEKNLIVLIRSYPFPSLNWIIKLSLNWEAVSYMEIAKRWINQKNIFWSTWRYFGVLAHFDFVPVLTHYTVYSYLWYSFLFVTLSQFSCFFWIQCKWLTFEMRHTKKILIKFHGSITTYHPSISGILLINKSKSDESVFVLDESIFI